MSTAVANLSKPRLRGLLRKSLQMHLAIAGTLSVSAAATWYFFFAIPRRERYAEFYRKYDANAEFERMRKLGLFRSCPVDK